MTRPRTLRDAGELAVVKRLVARLPRGRGVVVGPGDDAAVVRLTGQDQDLLLTSDPVVEGVHFTPGAPAENIGRKAVGRVLSDVAAMGGTPRWCLINVVAPPALPVRRLSRVYRGAARMAERCGVGLVGGDVSAGPVLELHAFAVGTVPRGTACRRSGARPHDLIFVTGSLGGSSLGRHLAVTPRLREGAWLRAGGWVSAMMDISDGLASDLPRLLAASGVGAEIDLDAVPLSAAARRLRDGRTALDHGLRDGEDFELLFTVPRRKRTSFLDAWKAAFSLRCTCIGRVTGEQGRIRWLGDRREAGNLDAGGYEHFRTADGRTSRHVTSDLHGGSRPLRRRGR